MPSVSKNVVVAAAYMLGRATAMLSHGDLSAVAAHLARRNHSAAMRNLARWSSEFSRHCNAPSQSIRDNGEGWLLARTASLGFHTLFDVGANVGNWTATAHRSHPNAALHCFEIVPDTFRILETRVHEEGIRNIALNATGLSDSAGEVDVFVSPESNVLSSVYRDDSGGADMEVLRCKIERGDDYVRERRIEQIDFLKIDVEGAEGRVLLGFRELLERRGVRLLQFEYNRSAILARFLLRDFYELLEPLGYRLGRLYPSGVEFHDYGLEREDFVGPNYVACRRDDHALIELIAL